MSRESRLLATALRAQSRPHRSWLIAFCGVLVRAGVWGLLIFGLAVIVPRVLPAMLALQPKLPPPRGPVITLIDFIRNPEQSIPAVAGLLLFIDLPFSYLSTGSLVMRRWWSRLMLMIPLGIGLVAAIGFAFLYVQLLTLMMRDVGIRA